MSDENKRVDEEVEKTVEDLKTDRRNQPRSGRRGQSAVVGSKGKN